MKSRVRVRLTKRPTARDLEFFALRFLQIGETYEVDGALATYLVEWGHAVFASEDTDEDVARDDHTPEPDNGSNDASA